MNDAVVIVMCLTKCFICLTPAIRQYRLDDRFKLAPDAVDPLVEIAERCPDSAELCPHLSPQSVKLCVNAVKLRVKTLLHLLDQHVDVPLVKVDRAEDRPDEAACAADCADDYWIHYASPPSSVSSRASSPQSCA
jgi:hypothetical protein